MLKYPRNSKTYKNTNKSIILNKTMTKKHGKFSIFT